MKSPSIISISAPGLLSTVQDSGRWGHQQYGVSVSGAMDVMSLHWANRLVGNQSTAAALEVTLIGPTLHFENGSRFAVCGAAFDLKLDDHHVSLDTLIEAGPGQTLTFGRRTSGARAYLAVAGGFDVAPVLGSRSTHVPSHMGGFEGRPLKRGDRLTIGMTQGVPVRPAPESKWKKRALIGGACVRVLPGAHHDWFDADAVDHLQQMRCTVSPVSDRMGYRLSGDRFCRRHDRQLLSQALPLGALQVLPSGGIIVAMADRQTCGGYPRIATVISADIPLLGQLAPGDWLEFVMCDRATARKALARATHEFAVPAT